MCGSTVGRMALLLLISGSIKSVWGFRAMLRPLRTAARGMSQGPCRPVQAYFESEGDEVVISSQNRGLEMTAGPALPPTFGVARLSRVDGDRDCFCNREINMQHIRAVGFDMDYTLAQYNLAFELLAYDGAKKKLVEQLNYPEAVANFTYDSTYFRRGLVIDKERGNVLKMDRHKYVRQAYHGFTSLPTAVRKELYMSSSEKMPQYTESNYVNIDTLFLLVDAWLFAQLVDYKDRHPGVIKHSYATIYSHIRQCVDLCHRDGVIKDRVAENPGAYIVPDPGVVRMLKQYRASGRKTFLVTNSLWDYTDVVMNFLVGNSESEQRNLTWLDLFDIIIVGSRKPAFLMDPSALLLRVEPRDGTLRNVDGVDKPVDRFLHTGKVFQGGNWRHLLEMLELSSGDNVMYVGDHMYSDILKSKRSLGWRTCLVIPELADELPQVQRHRDLEERVRKLRRKRVDLDEELDQAYKVFMGISQQATHGAEEERVRKEVEKKLLQLRKEGEQLDAAIKAACSEYHKKFHPVWGRIFEAGFQQSRFAKQVSTYACIYTSKASNLGLVSPERWFRVVRDRMPHDELSE